MTNPATIYLTFPLASCTVLKPVLQFFGLT